jgi:predicted RNA binding protein YcfA (HicA-like mRNA interferase family)
MPKMRRLRAELRRLGYQCHQGKGSHQVWKRPGVARGIVLHGADGCDAKPYQLKRVRNAGCRRQYR